VHVRGGDRGLGDGDLVGRGRTGTRRNRGQGAPGRARGAEHKETKAVQLISVDGKPSCFLVGGGHRQATGRGGLAMVLREEGEVAAGPKRQGGAGAKQRGRGGSSGALSEKDEHGGGGPGAGLTEEEVGCREGEREKCGDEPDREEDGDEPRLSGGRVDTMEMGIEERWIDGCGFPGGAGWKGVRGKRRIGPRC